MLRMLMYNNTLAPHRDPKKIPKTIDGFMPLEQKRINKAQIEAIRRAKEEYLKNKK